MSEKVNMKYRLKTRISKHLPDEIWEIRENERVFIKSVKGSVTEHTPSGNWQPYFLRDNRKNPDIFEEISNAISGTNGGLFVVDPARRHIPEYLSRVFEDGGITLNKKVNELIDTVNKINSQVEELLESTK